MTITSQTTLFPELAVEHELAKPVNVASIPQRSPFRYPGGKTWFVPTFRKWVQRKHTKPKILIEPFVGGGIISLTALFENLVDSVLMVELDEDIAAVWQAVVDGHSKWLAKRILNFELTRESVIREISHPPHDIRERAFQTILKNRTFHGGILAEGSGLLKYGENGKGILSRWYPSTLARRFEHIDMVRGRIQFRHEDGLKTIREFSSSTDAIFFIDPPYTAGGKKAGKRLYKHCDIDHEGLFSLCEEIAGDFLITYDNAEEVRALARQHSFQMRLIPMTNTHHAQMHELVIGKDLSWMDHFLSVYEPKKEYISVKRLGTKPKGRIRRTINQHGIYHA